MSTPNIAVLLAAYNGMSWIEEQVASILGQQGVNVTLFISVDSSQDGTEAWCESLQEQHDNVKVLPFGLKFGGASRNFFRLFKDVDITSYDAVSLADQDDIWYVDKLARAYEAICTRTCDAYSSNVLAFWPDGRELLVEKHQPQVQFDYLFEAAGPGCTYLLSRSLVGEFKAFLLLHWDDIQDVTLHDWLIYAFARSHEKTWYVDPKPSMRYRQHANNQVGVNTGMDAKKARLRKVLSGWWLHQSLRIAKLLGMQNSPFVASWSALDAKSLMKLACASSKCRRRTKDKIYFFGLCFVLMLARIAGQKNVQRS